MTIRFRTRAHVFWRCLFLQAAWNRRGMQNLGFAYAIEPALDALYADPVRREEALARHLGFFNCHPYMAAAILGGAIHHEELVAAGAEPGAAPLSYKATLQGPLAAVGDGFFWTALRPFFGALAALGALVAGWPAVVAAVLLYNVVHFGLRFVLFRAGYQQGDAVVGLIAQPGPAAHGRSAAGGRGGPLRRDGGGGGAAGRWRGRPGPSRPRCWWWRRRPGPATWRCPRAPRSSRPPTWWRCSGPSWRP